MNNPEGSRGFTNWIKEHKIVGLVGAGLLALDIHYAVDGVFGPADDASKKYGVLVDGTCAEDGDPYRLPPTVANGHVRHFTRPIEEVLEQHPEIKGIDHVSVYRDGEHEIRKLTCEQDAKRSISTPTNRNFPKEK